MDYKEKYIKYKNKYFSLKNNFYKINEIVLYRDKNNYIKANIININKEDPNEYFYEIKLNNGKIRNTIFNYLDKIN